MVSEAEAGEQASPGDANSLAEAVVRLADRTHAERSEMGQRGRAWVTREHSREVLADRLDTLLREVVEQ
jgi:glycosyltransferase involved in cell wall biosynthesis